MKNYKEVGRWSVGTPDGDAETFLLEKSSEGDFRLKNEFGNICVEMELMSAFDFIKSMFELMQKELELDIENFLLNDDLDSQGIP